MPKKELGAKKAKIDAETVRHVAKIARLDLTDSEIRKFSHDLNDILAAFAILDKIKTNNKPSFQPLEIKDVLREDAEEKCLTQEEALANTKHKENGFFKGPRVV